MIAVEDPGFGIPAEALDRVFDAFAQVEQGSSIVRGGVGLGLPIAKWIAEQLGGALEVTSTEGRGSTFTLRVAIGPLDDAEWVTPGKTMAPAPPSARQRRGGARPRLKGKILLAEDFRDVRDLISHALVQAGADVKAVDDGEKAVKAASEQQFDLILMDVRMAGMDGATATAELRRRGCPTPIIALTASTTNTEHERILEAGFDNLWAKPISLEQLLERTADYLEAIPCDATADEDTSALDSTLETENPRLAAAVGEFVRNLPARLHKLEAAVGAGDLQHARELLHQLVGVAGIVGYLPVSEEAARVLARVKDGSLSGTDDLQRLENLADRIARGFLESASGSGRHAPHDPPAPEG